MGPPTWTISLVDHFVKGVLGRREPALPLEVLRVAKTPMYVSCEKAIMELGLPQTPVEDALSEAVRWFTNNGYVR